MQILDAGETPPGRRNFKIPRANISPVSSANISASPPPAAKPRRKRHFVLWAILGLFFLFLLWALFSANPFAQVVREILGQPPDQIVLNSPFSVSPHSFRYYTFRLPAGGNNVLLLGHFTAVDDTTPRGRPSSAEDKVEGGIEVLVLSESSFGDWHRGATPDSLYHSGPVSGAEIRVQIPRSEQLYYVVFSNRTSQSTSRRVDAKLVLRFRSWLPDWMHKLVPAVLVASPAI